MTLVLSETDYRSLSRETADSKIPDSKLLEDGVCYRLPAVLGHGYTHSLELMPGVWLDIIDKEFNQSWALKVPVHDHLVQIMLLLSGTVDYDREYPTSEASRGYFSGSGISRDFVAHYQQSQHLQGVNIHFDPLVIEPLLAEQAPALYQDLIRHGDWKKTWFPKVTPMMQTAAQQILLCPFKGATRRIYLQSKAFELLALLLEEVLTDQGQRNAAFGSEPNPKDYLEEARNLLCSQLENPPSIVELARRVGVCDRTLRRGFRRAFGTTVIGYLMQQRLIRAEQLLREKRHTVAEVANKVGYAHLGHFAAAFKRQFGITPSECLAGHSVSPDRAMGSS